MSTDQLAAEIATKLHERREEARRKSEARAALEAKYAKALADTLVSWDAADPGSPETRDEPGEQPTPSVVWLADEQLVGFPDAALYTPTLCEARNVERFVGFTEQGHNHSQEVPCADTYRQGIVRGPEATPTHVDFVEFEPLDYPPGQSPALNVIEPCPAAYREQYEVVVTSDDVARRLAACWNALRGIPTEALEQYSESIAILMDAWVDCKLYRERMDQLAAKTESDASPASRP